MKLEAPTHPEVAARLQSRRGCPIYTDMARFTMGIGEVGSSLTPGDSLMAVGLGSCVAVILYDPRLNAAALAHCMLPRHRESHAERTDKPALSVESGLPVLLEQMRRHGSRPHTLQAVLVGGAAMFEFTGPQVLDVGAQNIQAAHEALREYQVELRAEDLGGNRGRTVALTLPEGEVVVRTEGTEKTLVVLGRRRQDRAA